VRGVIDKQFIEEIKSRLVLSEQISRVVKVSRAGREYKACCPFHKEKTPSFTINDDKGFYHCFGCGAHGNVVDFRMRYHGQDFIEAVKDLASEAGLKVPERRKLSHREVSQLDKQKKRESDAYKILDLVTNWFQEQLHKSENRFVKDYILKRDLADKTLADFRIGYAPNDWQSLTDFLQKSGCDLDLACDLGLLKKSQKRDAPYAFFRGRLMFPVTDRKGRVIAFGGRHLEQAFTDRELGDFDPPKYLNSPDHFLFHKGKIVYNYARSLRSRDPTPVIMVEGYMDVIALAQAGFDRAVAPLGTSVTEEQMSILWKLTQRAHVHQPSVSGGVRREEVMAPFVCFDGDNAGQRAAYRLLDKAVPLIKIGQSLKFVFMPDGEDPDSVLRDKGQKAFENLLQASKSPVAFLWDYHTSSRDIKNADQLAKLEHDLNIFLTKISDDVLQRHYRQEIQSSLWTLRRQKNDRPKSQGKYGSHKATAPVSALKSPDTQQIMFAHAVLLALKLFPLVVLTYRKLLDEFLAVYPACRPLIIELSQNSPPSHAGAENEEAMSEARLCVEKHLSNEPLRTKISALDFVEIETQNPFLHERAEIWDVRQGLDMLTNQLERHAMLDELNQLRDYLKKNPNERGFERLIALQELLSNSDDEELT